MRQLVSIFFLFILQPVRRLLECCLPPPVTHSDSVVGLALMSEACQKLMCYCTYEWWNFKGWSDKRTQKSLDLHRELFVTARGADMISVTMCVPCQWQTDDNYSVYRFNIWHQLVFISPCLKDQKCFFSVLHHMLDGGISWESEWTDFLY